MTSRFPENDFPVPGKGRPLVYSAIALLFFQKVTYTVIDFEISARALHPVFPVATRSPALGADLPLLANPRRGKSCLTVKKRWETHWFWFSNISTGGLHICAWAGEHWSAMAERLGQNCGTSNIKSTKCSIWPARSSCISDISISPWYEHHFWSHNEHNFAFQDNLLWREKCREERWEK